MLFLPVQKENAHHPSCGLKVLGCPLSGSTFVQFPEPITSQRENIMSDPQVFPQWRRGRGNAGGLSDQAHNKNQRFIEDICFVNFINIDKYITIT